MVESTNIRVKLTYPVQSSGVMTPAGRDASGRRLYEPLTQWVSGGVHEIPRETYYDKRQLASWLKDKGFPTTTNVSLA